MKITCSYCMAAMGEKEPLDDTRHSHSICPACYEKLSQQWAGEEMAEDLNEVDTPIAIVERDVRFIAVNRAMSELIGATTEEVQGLRGGEVLGCAHSHLETGCGTAPECGSCPLRGTVNLAVAGEDQIGVPAHVDLDDARLLVTIGAHLEGDLVQLTIEQVRGTVPLPDDEP